MYWEYGWMLDGEKITDGHKFLEMTSNAPNCYSQETIGASKWQLSAGTHTLSIWTRIEAYGDINCSYWSYYSFYNRQTVTITYADQKTEIASNGFQVRFGSDQMLKCVKSGNDISLMMQADTEGIEVSTNNGIRFRFGGTWYTASRQYNSTLGTYYLKLT
jgi:hypothetical protein